MIRIILDTNWYISATINRTSRRTFFDLLTNKNLVVIFSDTILKEYKEVIRRDKFKRIINPSQINRFMNLVISRLENVEIKADLEGSRDPNDNFLLSLSFDSKADYLITGDIDLLILKITGTTQIITLNDFLKIISRKIL
ncbi:MAG: putative toxin-antitoxin system toxin component, PIN family [Mucilaginibacter sp.]